MRACCCWCPIADADGGGRGEQGQGTSHGRRWNGVVIEIETNIDQIRRA
jgi:hypothetical protein